MTERSGRQIHQPLWAPYHASRRTPDGDRPHRRVHHRHGFVFGFPLCSAIELGEYFDDPAND